MKHRYVRNNTSVPSENKSIQEPKGFVRIMDNNQNKKNQARNQENNKAENKKQNRVNDAEQENLRAENNNQEYRNENKKEREREF